MDQIKGNIQSLSAMQLTEEMEGLDAESKTLLRNKEILAVILQGTIEEYAGYSREEIMNFIEADSIVSTREVSPGRSNTQTQIHGDHAEFVQLNEKTSHFDVIFKAKNPLLSKGDVLINLHVDVEPQKTYKPGYPIEKRGMYYLARSLSSQLSLVTGRTDYGQLEKCYSIWICRDDINAGEEYSISFYEMTNTKNIGKGAALKEDYDLLKLVVIKLGDKVYNGKAGEEGFELLRFLNMIMYPHREDFMETMSEYIDFSDNEELWQEAEKMEGLGQSILEEGIREGMEKGMQEGIVKGMEKGIIKGHKEGVLAALCSLVNDGLLKLEEAARRVNLSEAEFCDEMKRAGY